MRQRTWRSRKRYICWTRRSERETTSTRTLAFWREILSPQIHKTWRSEKLSSFFVRNPGVKLPNSRVLNSPIRGVHIRTLHSFHVSRNCKSSLWKQFGSLLTINESAEKFCSKFSTGFSLNSDVSLSIFLNFSGTENVLRTEISFTKNIQIRRFFFLFFNRLVEKYE